MKELSTRQIRWLIEIENKKKIEFSSKRLIKLLEKAHKQSAESAVKQIMEQTKRFAEGLEPLDDQTLLLVKHRGDSL